MNNATETLKKPNIHSLVNAARLYGRNTLIRSKLHGEPKEQVGGKLEAKAGELIDQLTPWINLPEYFDIKNQPIDNSQDELVIRYNAGEKKLFAVRIITSLSGERKEEFVKLLEKETWPNYYSAVMNKIDETISNISGEKK